MQGQQYVQPQPSPAPARTCGGRAGRQRSDPARGHLPARPNAKLGWENKQVQQKEGERVQRGTESGLGTRRPVRVGVGSGGSAGCPGTILGAAGGEDAAPQRRRGRPGALPALPALQEVGVFAERPFQHRLPPPAAAAGRLRAPRAGRRRAGAAAAAAPASIQPARGRRPAREPAAGGGGRGGRARRRGAAAAAAAAVTAAAFARRFLHGAPRRRLPVRSGPGCRPCPAKP